MIHNIVKETEWLFNSCHGNKMQPHHVKPLLMSTTSHTVVMGNHSEILAVVMETTTPTSRQISTIT